MIPSKVKVLDYGCGWGCLTRAIAEKGNEVTGIDMSHDAIEIALDFNSHPNVNFFRANIKDFEDESFDVVNSNQVLEHVHNPGIYLKNCNRILRKGGFLVVSVPNVINLNFLFVQLSKGLNEKYESISMEVLENYSKDSHHIQAWDPVAFVRLLASTGFLYVEHKFVEGVYLPIGPSRHTRWPLGGSYYHTKNKRLKNLSYTMLFKMKKVRFLDIYPED